MILSLVGQAARIPTYALLRASLEPRSPSARASDELPNAVFER